MLKRTINPFIVSLLLIVVVLVGSVLFGDFVSTNPASLKLDGHVYTAFADGYRSPLLDILVWPINNNFLHVAFSTFPSYYLVWLGLFFVYLAVFQRKDFIFALLKFVIAGVLISSVLLVDNHFIYRQRPYLTLPNHLNDMFKSALVHWNSYPSGHARDTVIYSMIMASTVPVLTAPLTFFSLFVAWSRLYVGAHFPSDVLAAILVGLGLGKVTLMLGKEVEKLIERIKRYGK